ESKAMYLISRLSWLKEMLSLSPSAAPPPGAALRIIVWRSPFTCPWAATAARPARAAHARTAARRVEVRSNVNSPESWGAGPLAHPGPGERRPILPDGPAAANPARTDVLPGHENVHGRPLWGPLLDVLAGAHEE